jgi:hypothetical protein
MKRLLFGLALISLLTPQLLFAQEATSELTPPGPSLEQVGAAAGNVSCFDYYHFGSVQASLEANLSSTVPGATIEFMGTIKNDNDYPIVNGSLYVKIFHRDENTFSQGDGNPVVDQFFIKDTYSIKGKGEKQVSFSWKVPENAKEGEYYIATFFTTENRYNLSGLSFTDDVIGNSANFSVVATGTNPVFLDKTKATLNDQNHSFAAFPLHFSKEENVVAKTTLTNPGDQPQVVQVTWQEYMWDAQRKENLKNQKFELVELGANQSKELSYTVPAQNTAVSYLVVTAKDQYSQSVQGMRFVRDGVEETRINFPSLTSFPIKKGEVNSLFACAHSTNLPVVGGNIMTLTLRDDKQNVIHEYKYEGDISGSMGGWKDDFTSTKSYDKVTLTATLQRNGSVVEEVTIPYDCEVIDKDSCNASSYALSDLSPVKKGGILLIVLLTLIALGAIFVSRGKKSASRFK